jgi:Ca2+-binding EF-hand superfamily protein
MRIPQIIPTVLLLTLAVPAVQAAGAKKPAGAPAQTPQTAQPAAPSAQPFANLDADHDGKVSREEWKGNAVNFAMLDTNGDGALTGDEMKPSSQAAPAPPSPADTFAQMDADHNGRLTGKEWTAGTSDFDRMDHNHDGAVSRDEFLNLDRTRTRREGLFRLMDKNRDGRLSRAEWKGDAEDFDRRDRNHDGAVTKDEYIPK